MSGHSKWKNIMHKKEKTDAQRAKIFTKIGREISLAVREGGPDPVSNSVLKDLIAKDLEAGSSLSKLDNLYKLLLYQANMKEFLRNKGYCIWKLLRLLSRDYLIKERCNF